jgi:hypothetical protein
MQSGYSRYLNRKYKHRHWLAASHWTSPLRAQTEGRIHRSVNYPGRYECFRVSAGLLKSITHFVEQSPARLGCTGDAGTYPWSSAPARLKGRCARKIVQLIRLGLAPERWTSHLAIAPDRSFLASVEISLRRGGRARSTSVPSSWTRQAEPAPLIFPSE